MINNKCSTAAEKQGVHTLRVFICPAWMWSNMRRINFFGIDPSDTVIDTQNKAYCSIGSIDSLGDDLASGSRKKTKFNPFSEIQ